MAEYREIVIKIPEEIISFVNLNGFLPENYRSAMGKILLDGVELPKEHGKLIYADKLIKWCKTNDDKLMDGYYINHIVEETAIIKADIEESNW